MADLLGEVDHNASGARGASKTVKSEARRKIRVLSPPLSRGRSRRQKVVDASDGYLPDTPPAEVALDEDDTFMRNVDDDEIPSSDPPLPSSPTTNAAERKAPKEVKKEEDEMDDQMDVAPTVGHSGIASTSVNISASRPAPAIKKPPYPSPASSSPTRAAPETIDPSSWNDVTTKLNVLSSSPITETPSFGKLTPPDALEEDGSLRMFWIDYIEVNGSLCLFGKVKNKSNGSYVSCFVKVDNILRKLYFLTRTRRHRTFFPHLVKSNLTYGRRRPGHG